MKLITSQLLDPNKLPQLPQTPADQPTLNKILTFIFVTIGALAVLMIVIAGLRYIVARGEPTKMAEAKNMILYSLIGLVIAALAATIVNYALGRA
ncbi:MAG: pilin [Candidatus Saccharimonadales bacterium]